MGKIKIIFNDDILFNLFKDITKDEKNPEYFIAYDSKGDLHIYFSQMKITYEDYGYVDKRNKLKCLYTILDIAGYLIGYYNQKNKTISARKLHLLCYYVYSWFLYLHNNNNDIRFLLFENDFQAWIHGATSLNLYNILNHKYNIKKTDISYNIEELDSEIKEFINHVLNEYGDFSATELESICKQELPYIVARGSLKKWENCDTVINDLDIFREYDQRYSSK